MVLPNQASSTNCYSDSGTVATNNRNFLALLVCTMTPGAYLWRPNTEAEAAAVRNKYNFPNDVFVWTGANDVDGDGTFTFAIENGQLNVATPPFGTGVTDGTGVSDCVGIRFVAATMTWEWSERLCTETLRYICEYPRRVCP
ncbi:uncharacterized protein LOC143043607 [Mytilus galloprovincialis]|uniref:uncharacterized protein LOC143043607 n=1 Tax=Mytilus galloprovincialis TaxID=29158 RepID=UPI003F7BFB96